MESVDFCGIAVSGIQIVPTGAGDTIFFTSEKLGSVTLKNDSNNHRMVAVIQNEVTAHIGDLAPGAEVAVPLQKGLAWLMVAPDLVNFKAKLIYAGMSSEMSYTAPELRGPWFEEFIQKNLGRIR